MIKYNWTVQEALEIYNQPFPDLIYRAATVHRKFHQPCEVQVSALLSIKTGGCTEDCGYCPQAARYNTDVKAHKLLSIEEVVSGAEKAKKAGASRFCIGAAWREVRDNRDFDNILEMVRKVNATGMQVCCTLGMLTEAQALKLAEAGAYAYNHNLDTSEDFYGEIITTRTYNERLNTLKNVRNAGMTVCCGGIIGMGESTEDRMEMLVTLAGMNPHPESVPINSLVAVAGTPLENQKPVPALEFTRMIATARIMLPSSRVRLSAGRLQMSRETQALCFLAGANSIFAGDKLLTTANPELCDDKNMFEELGMTLMK